MSKQKKQKPAGPRRAEAEPRAAIPAVKRPSESPRDVIASVPRSILMARVCLVVASAVALYLLWISIRGGSVAGCGPGSDCDKVLQSRWSKWFGLPVSGFSLLIYAGLFGASLRLDKALSVDQRRRAGGVILTGGILVLGAAAWYTVVQVAVIHAICPYCMTAHALGSVAAILLLFARSRDEAAVGGGSASFQPIAIAVSMLLVLIGGQALHEPRSHIERNVTAIVSNASVVTSAGTAVQRTNADAAPAQAMVVAKPPPAPVSAATNLSALPAVAPGTNRLFAIYNGQFKFNLDEVPLIGSPGAPHVMVSLFDYTCHHCRTMHERLIEAHHLWSNQLAIITLPMPLDPKCNPTMTRPHPDHINACFFGRLGLAVVRADRTKAAQFDEFVFKPERPPGTNDALMFAEQLVSADALRRALVDPWVENQLKQAVAIYEISYRAGQGAMPQSVIGNRIAVGLLRAEDLARILEGEFGLKAAAP